MADSAIEWTDKTWNPVTGCTKVSPGCAHCYAEGVADRFWGQQYPKIEFCAEQPPRRREFTDVMVHPDRLDQPLRWKKPARVFVNSMSDLFHESVPDEFIDRVFSVMFLSPKHTFQILTKRAARMRDYMRSRTGADEGHVAIWTELGPTGSDGYLVGNKYRVPWPLPNVWLGVSVENQHFADERIPLLLQTPAAVRFISAEPLLGPVKLGYYVRAANFHDGTPDPRTRLDWVIVGGESGAGARLFDVEWARGIVEQCRVAGVPVFVKQLGANPVEAWPNGPTQFHSVRLRSKKGGDMAEWPSELQVREFPSGVEQADACAVNDGL